MNWDNELWSDFREGKLERLYKEAYPGLVTYAAKYLGQESDFLAEDCVQDAIFTAWQRRERFVSAETLKSFLYTSIKNTIVSIARKNKAKENYAAQLEEEAYFRNSVIEQEAKARIYKAIDELPEREREVFELSFEEGLKNVEIAERLHLSDSSIKKYKASALEMLQKKLSPDLFLIISGLLLA